MYGETSSSEWYRQWRRQRAWSMNTRNGLHGYAAYLNGFGQEGNEVGPMVGAAAAAYEADGRAEMSRAIYIGVATGVLTFLVNRFLGKVLG